MPSPCVVAHMCRYDSEAKRAFEETGHDSEKADSSSSTSMIIKVQPADVKPNAALNEAPSSLRAVLNQTMASTGSSGSGGTGRLLVGAETTLESEMAPHPIVC